MLVVCFSLVIVIRIIVAIPVLILHVFQQHLHHTTTMPIDNAVRMHVDTSDNDASTTTEVTKNDKTTVKNKHTYLISLQNSRKPEQLALQHIELISIIADQYPTTIFYSNINNKALMTTQHNKLITTKSTYSRYFQVWSRRGPRALDGKYHLVRKQ